MGTEDLVDIVGQADNVGQSGLGIVGLSGLGIWDRGLMGTEGLLEMDDEH